MSSINKKGAGVGRLEQMFNRMISHFAGEQKAPAKSRNFNALDSRYVESLSKLYARVYGN